MDQAAEAQLKHNILRLMMHLLTPQQRQEIAENMKATMESKGMDVTIRERDTTAEDLMFLATVALITEEKN
jgi:predicted amino acid-binding ACT domain protein